MTGLSMSTAELLYRRVGRLVATAAVLTRLCSAPVAAQTLTAGNVSGSPGDTVWFDVTFDPQGISVAATLNRIVFDPFNTPITTCVIGDVPDKQFERVLLPVGCGPGSVPCTSVRVLVWDGVDQQPQAILTPVVLYRCRVDIPASAAAGSSFAIILDSLSATDPPGNPEALNGVWGSFSIPGPGGGCTGCC